MSLIQKGARQLGGTTGTETELQNDSPFRPEMAYAFNAIDRFPDASFALLQKAGLVIEVVLAEIPAALLASVLTGRPPLLFGRGRELAETFMADAEVFTPVDEEDALHWLRVLLRQRVSQWFPVLLEHLAAELRRGSLSQHTVADRLHAILDILEAQGGRHVHN